MEIVTELNPKAEVIRHKKEQAILTTEKKHADKLSQAINSLFVQYLTDENVKKTLPFRVHIDCVVSGKGPDRNFQYKVELSAWAEKAK